MRNETDPRPQCTRAARLSPLRTWAAALALILAACGEESANSVEPDPGSTYSQAARFRYQAHDGTEIGTEQLAGRVWIATRLDTRCLQGCATARERLQQMVEASQSARANDRVHVVGFAPDPRDDKQALADYAAAHALRLERWSLVTAPEGELELLCREGFGRPLLACDEDEGHIAALVDRAGRVRAHLDLKAGDATAQVREALALLLAEPASKRVVYPREAFDAGRLQSRAAAQRAAATHWKVRHDFRFVDRRRESGIRFLHRIVDDAGLTYKPVHYDHGNGVAVADVDGDGRYDLYFSNQVGSNQLWRNLGGGRFEDITAKAGVAVRDPVGVTASFADTDNDGDPDLYVTSVRGGNFLFQNDGTGRFKDVTAASGLAYSGHSSSGVFFDYDRDGLLDLFLCNVGVYTSDRIRTVVDDTTTSGQEPGRYEYYDGVPDAFSGHLREARTERSILYRNLGGNRFQDVSEATGLVDESWTGDASPVDMNEDGWIDLYVLNMQGHDEYYENRGGKKFVRKSRAIFPKTPWGAMGIKVFDFDGDGRLDIYITDMHSDMSLRVGPDEEKLKSSMRWPESLLRSNGLSIFGNAFFRRAAPNRVEEISDAIGAENYWPWGLSVGDLNADGYDDAFIASSMNYFFRYGVNSVLLNDAGKRFLDSEFVLGVEPRAGPLFKPWFDLDCSRSRDREHALCEGEDGPVTAWAPLGSRSSVIFDLDGDGDLDVVTNDMNSEPLVLVSDLADRHPVRFLKIRLRGTKSNRDGLGSIVRVHAGGRTQTKVHDGQSGYLSQSSQLLYFGLGNAGTVARIEVRWPSGKTQVVSAPKPLNRVLEILEV